MFGRFKKKKDDSTKGGPPGTRGAGPNGGANGAAGGGGAPLGGGFFNLPPPVAKGGGGGGGGSAPYPSTVPAYGAPQQQHPQQQQQPAPPHYGGQPSVSAPPPAASNSGGMDMFGGMSIKNPSPMKPSPSLGPSQPYGGSGGYGMSTHNDLPLPPAAAAPASGSLFSGLDFSSTAPTTFNGGDDELSRPVVERRKSSSSARGSYNYLDVAASSATSGMGASGGAGGAASFGITRPSGSKVKKKKVKSFRPGFGRQLSDESIAALQRGDLNEEELMQQVSTHAHDNDRSHSHQAPPAMATNATDLAHLLPPVRSGSVLAGLTVHGGGPTSSGGGVLAGLTVHDSSATSASPSSPRQSVNDEYTSKPSDRAMSVRNQSSFDANDASTSVVLPSSRESPPEVAVERKKPIQTEKANPPPPSTPEERLLVTLRDFHESAVNFRDSALKQNEEENRILERKSQLAKQLTQYEIDLRDVEAQQQQACEVEDFEKADALNSTINSVKHCITLSESDVRKVDSELAAFLKAKEKAFTNQLRSTRGTLKELEKFRDDQDTERGALRAEFKSYHHEQTEQLQFEAERIDTEMHHVSVNYDHLTSEKAEIEATIEEQCKSEFTARDKLLSDKEAIEEDIRELERQLKEKRKQVEGIQTSIDKAERDIDVVRNRYSRQLKRVAEREEGIQKTRMGVQADAESLKQEREQFAERVHDYEERISAFGKRMATVRKEMRAATLLANVLEVQESRHEQAGVRKKQHAAELTALADAAAIAQQSFTMLTKQHDDLEKSLSMHRNAIASAEAMIPRLEQEKKTAATQRNFKEAARISKDIKALEKDQSTAEEMVEVVEMELQDLKERIDKRGAEFEEKKEEQKRVEKQLELSALHELWKESKHLHKSLRQIKKVKTEGTASADGIDFRSSALLLVQAEYDACMVQVEALEKKYDVSDPTPEDDVDDDEDDDDDDESVDDEIELISRSVINSSTGDVESGSAGGGGSQEMVGDEPSTLEGIAAKLLELEAMIEKATENEEYELAAKLDDKVDALKLRQHAIQTRNEDKEQALYPAVPISGESSDGQDEETFNHVDNGNYGGNDAEDKLRLVATRISMLEADIERATENEEYDAAAEMDDELEQLREEERAIREHLGHASNDYDALGDDNDEPPAAPNALFNGLGMKQESADDTSEELVSNVENSRVVTEDTTDESHYGSSVGPDLQSNNMFGGLQVATSSPLNEGSVSSNASPANVASPVIGSGPNSPRRKSSGGMFMGLQVSTSSSHVSTQSNEALEKDGSNSMFDGLQVDPAASSSPKSPIERAEDGTEKCDSALSQEIASEHDEVSSRRMSSLSSHSKASSLRDIAADNDDTEPASQPLSLGDLSSSADEGSDSLQASGSSSMFDGLSMSFSDSANAALPHATAVENVSVEGTDTEVTKTPEDAEVSTSSSDIFGGLSVSSTAVDSQQRTDEL